MTLDQSHKNQYNSSAIVFIDGENLIYQLIDILVRNKLIKQRADLQKIDIISLFAKAVKDNIKPIQVRYYGTKLHEVDDLGEEVHEQSKVMLQHRKDWDKWLKIQHIEFITAGNLKARKRGDQVVFQEKGVDVRIAVDMVQSAYENKNLHFVIISNDSDIIPALRIVKEQKHMITYVGMRGNLNKAIKGNVDKVVSYSKEDIINSFKRTNQ